MKNTLFNISTLIIASILFLGSSCKEEEVLPPATEEGLNTFGCLVNGELWKPEGRVGQTPRLDASYDPTYDNGTFDIAAYRIRSDDDRQYMYIYTTNMDKIGSYRLNALDTGAATYSNPLCSYDRDPSIYRDGILNITKFDLQNQVVSGTFEFVLAMPGCDTLKVTNGRFDMKF